MFAQIEVILLYRLIYRSMIKVAWKWTRDLHKFIGSLSSKLRINYMRHLR